MENNTTPTPAGTPPEVANVGNVHPAQLRRAAAARRRRTRGAFGKPRHARKEGGSK